MSFKKAKTLKNDKINENYFLKTFFIMISNYPQEIFSKF